VGRLFRENHQELYPAGHHQTSGELECQRGLRDLVKLTKQQPDPFSAVSAPVLAPALSHHCPGLNETGERLVGCKQFEASLAGVTESQNHRMVGVGRDLCGSSSPTPLPKQGHLQ